MTIYPDTSRLKVEAKTKQLEADASSEVLVMQALQRRALALDQANVVDFLVLDAWHQKMLRARLAVPPPGFMQVSFRQMIHADQKLFLELSDLTRTGIQATATGRPMDAQVPIASALHEVMCLLQLLPLAGQAGRSASSWDKGDQDRPERFMPYGKGKPKGKGAGKGKFSPVPTALRGCRSHTNKGNPICFGYGLGTCKNAVKNNSCEKALHICAWPNCGGVTRHCTVPGGQSNSLSDARQTWLLLPLLRKVGERRACLLLPGKNSEVVRSFEGSASIADARSETAPTAEGGPGAASNVAAGNKNVSLTAAAGSRCNADAPRNSADANKRIKLSVPETDRRLNVSSISPAQVRSASSPEPVRVPAQLFPNINASVRPSGLIFVEACCGSATLSAACKDQGFDVLAVDFEGNKHLPAVHAVKLDLRRSHAYGTFLSMCWRLTPSFTSMAPLLVELPPDRLLRSELEPRGLPSLRGVELAKAQSANEIYDKIASFCTMLSQRKVQWSVEQPARSYMWFIDPWPALCSKNLQVFYDACMHGGERKKAQLLLTNVPELQTLARLCDNSHSHSSWKPKLLGFPTAKEAASTAGSFCSESNSAVNGSFAGSCAQTVQGL